MYFNASDVEIIKNSFEPLPPANYQVVVETAEERKTKAGTGKLVATTFQIIGGNHAGRKLFNNFNIENPSAEAQQIGRSDFAKFLNACHTPVLKTLEELTGKTCVVTVKTQKNKSTGEDQNVIRDYKSIKSVPTYSAASKATDDHPLF